MSVWYSWMIHVNIDVVFDEKFSMKKWSHAAERRRRRVFCHAAADFCRKRRRASLLSHITNYKLQICHWISNLAHKKALRRRRSHLPQYTWQCRLQSECVRYYTSRPLHSRVRGGTVTLWLSVSSLRASSHMKLKWITLLVLWYNQIEFIGSNISIFQWCLCKFTDP